MESGSAKPLQTFAKQNVDSQKQNLTVLRFGYQATYMILLQRWPQNRADEIQMLEIVKPKPKA